MCGGIIPAAELFPGLFLMLEAERCGEAQGPSEGELSNPAQGQPEPSGARQVVTSVPGAPAHLPLQLLRSRDPTARLQLPLRNAMKRQPGHHVTELPYGQEAGRNGVCHLPLCRTDTVCYKVHGLLLKSSRASLPKRPAQRSVQLASTWLALLTATLYAKNHHCF